MTNGDTLTAADAKVIEMHLAGASGAAIARELGVSRQAVHKHLRKHAADVAAQKQALVDTVVDNWITDKTQRLAKLSEIYAGLDEVRTTYGFMVTTEDQDEGGERKIYDQHFNGQLAAQMRGVLSDAADELGQKPKTPVNVNIDNRTQQVFVRQVLGSQVELG